VPSAYTLGEKLYEGRACAVHRAVDARSGRPVIVKLLRAEVASTDELRRIRKERDLLAAIDDPGVPRLVDYEEQGIDARLVIEDIGGESLARRTARGALPLAEALRIGAAIARALGAVHGRQIVHRDVNPNNVAIAPDGRVQLFDFDLAAQLPGAAAGLPPASRCEGTVPYVSPEQTGRGSLPIDERSDLYSLGATLYELCTGRPPFEGADALEVIHAHLARRPAPPHEIVPAIPEIVSAIVLRLLEKNPADRYQSAFGVERDLLSCADALASGGAIPAFPLGRRDVPARLRLADRVHGREAELARIVAAFDACAAGRPALVVVAGPAGIGKSALVRAFTRHAASAGCFAGAGKLEAEQPDAPYAAFVEPLRGLAQQIFAAGAGEVAALRTRVASTLGGAGRPLVDLVPELSFLLDGGPEERGAAPALSRDRARMLFTDLVRALARPERPIVLALDDAQWADPASLDLLGALAREKDIRGLCLVVTARDEGLAPGQPLRALLSELAGEGSAPVSIALAPLGISAVDAILADALGVPAGEASELAALIERKTNGNALSARVFLSALGRDRLVFFDAAAGRWAWDAAAIDAMPVADNVVALLSQRAAELGEDARRALRVGACLGGRFDAETVAAIGGAAVADAAAALGEAAGEGLLVPFEGGFRFAHDRVLDAVYRSISPEEARALHAAACRALRAAIVDAERDPRLFDLLRHAAAAGDAFGVEERLALARLGLTAGRRARVSAAFEAAQAHLAAAIERLPGDAWARDPGLAHDLHFAAVECAYAAGRFADGDRLFPVLASRAPSDEARARAWGMRAIGGVGARRYAEAIEHARRGCALLGLRLPEKASAPLLLYELARTSRALKGRSIEQLAALPPLSEPRVAATLDVLSAGMAAAYLSDRNLFIVMALRGVALIAKHGNCAASSDLYALYGLVVGAVLRDHRRMVELGRLGVAMSERYPDPAHACRALMLQGTFFQHHADHVRTSLPVLQEAQRLGLLSSENSVPGITAYFVPLTAFFAGSSLDDVLATCDAQLRVTAQLHAKDPHDALILFRQVLLALQGKTQAPGSLSSADFDADRWRAHIDRHGTLSARMSVRLFTALPLAYLDRPAEALARLDDMPGDVEREWGSLYQLGEHAFLRALLLSAIAGAGGLGFVERERHLISLRLAVRKVAAWAERAPANFAHKHALASAELSALTGDADAAVRRYEEAIQGARSGGFVQDMALAQERAGRFFLQRGMVDLGVSYLAAAQQTYGRWGAAAKVAQLDRELPGLSQRREARVASGSESSTRSAGTLATGTGLDALDAPTIVKATRLLSSVRDVGGLIERMMEIVAESAGAQRAALVLYEGEGAARGLAVVAQVAAGQAPSLFPAPKPIDEVATVPAAILRWVARTGQHVLLDDATAEGPFTRDPYVRSRRSRSVLAMPLVWQGEVLGVLSLENELVPSAFGERRVELYAMLCVQLAISLQNARHYAELERKVGERTRALKDAQSRIVALEKDATEVQMAGGFAHEMRNALAGARMVLKLALGTGEPEGAGLSAEASRRLHDLLVAVSPSLSGEPLAALRDHARALNDALRQVDEILRRADDAVGRGLGIIQEVQSYAALRREERGESLVPVRPIVEALARDLAAPGLRFEVNVPPGVAVPCKPDHLRSILENLVRNACEAAVERAVERAAEAGPRSAGGPASPGASEGGRVAVTARSGPSRVTIEVEDDGPGMTPGVAARIFEPFFSTKPTRGIGLGLGVVRKLVSLYEGQIAVDSSVGRGTRFTLTLPAWPAAARAPELAP
jgi:predicted ATPase/signal transduction histidine kinase